MQAHFFHLSFDSLILILIQIQSVPDQWELVWMLNPLLRMLNPVLRMMSPGLRKMSSELKLNPEVMVVVKYG